MQCLGIDIGSTSIKGAVLHLQTRSVGSPLACPFPAPIVGLPESWVEIDPRSVCSAIDAVLAQLMDMAPEAEHVFVSGQMGGVILIDDDAEPLTNYLSWRDQRTLAAGESCGSLLDEIRTCWETENLFGSLGRELQPGSMTTLLKWLDVAGLRSHRGIPVSIADFAIARLVGCPVPMHATHAIGLLDLARDDWHRPALEWIGLGEVRLPVLSLGETCVGTTTIAGREMKLYGSYGDQQCALRGAGLQQRELSLNISTGSQVSRRVSTFQPGDYQSRKYFFGDSLDTVTHLPAGRSLNALVDLLTELAVAEGVALKSPWKSIQAKVADVQRTDLKVDLSFFRSPLGDHGRIEGITTENLRIGHLFHASFRAMAENYRRIADRFVPADWTSLVISGGMTDSMPLLRDFIEERFPQPIRHSDGEETLLGLLDIAHSILT